MHDIVYILFVLVVLLKLKLKGLFKGFKLTIKLAAT